MKIVIVEERNGQQLNERTFSQESIKIGRDPAECHIVFDQTQWPMVSRRHAEIQFRDGKCQLVDLNSSFGTFHNSRKVAGTVNLVQGDTVQFGAGGPSVRAKVLDASAPVPPASSSEQDTFRDLPPSSPVKQPQSPPPPATAPPPRVQAAPPAPPPVKPAVQPPPKAAAPPPAPPPAPAKPAAGASHAVFVELINASTGQLQRIPVTKDLVTMGRDPSTDITLDASSAVVSRNHAEIRKQNGQFMLFDKGSFNGTLLNDQRITTPTPLYDNDRVQLGLGGPILRFSAPAFPAPLGASLAGQRGVSGSGIAAPPAPAMPAGGRPGMHTMVFTGGATGAPAAPAPPRDGSQQLLMRLVFDATRTQFTIGRAADNDIHLDGLQISNHHAKLVRSGNAVSVEDVGSTNGTYINGKRTSGREQVQGSDTVQVGPFVVRLEADGAIAVYDTRSKTRIDAIDITKVVKNRSGGGNIKLLDDVDITVQPNEFVGLLGPSGAGKSTLMDALNGMRPASSGHVLINNLDLYQHLDSLKQGIGYVPQDDIIHRELTVYRTLYYVARLRLSRDISASEIDQIVNEVMDVTGLAERRDVPVGQLSGGQRKRVSIAVELVTKPSVIFLDEPTSGLDPATEEKIMKLFRQIAESGRTVILTTHAMENVRLFDKIVVMMRGKLVFYGTPQEALNHVNAESFKELYDKLEEPIDENLRKMGPPPANASPAQKKQVKQKKEQISDQVAEDWRQKYQRTDAYRRNVVEPLTGINRSVKAAAPAKTRMTLFGSIRQLLTLSRRYLEVLSRDKFNLLILFAQAPIIAFLTYLVVGDNEPRDFPYFVMALVAVWFGTSISAREVIRERAVYNRERMVNLGLFPYIGSKLLVLTFIVGLQVFLLFLCLQFFSITGLMKLDGSPVALFYQVIIMLLTAMVGIAIGLFVSAVVKTSEMATSLVPLMLIPQILFSGLVGVPTGASRVIGLVMPATWSFDAMKRSTGLDTLKPEGSNPNGPNGTKGLFDSVKAGNDKNVDKAKKDLDQYKADATKQLDDYKQAMKDYLADKARGFNTPEPDAPEMKDPPKIPDPVEIPDNLSNYINFLHPWMSEVLNPLVLLLMFFGLILATVIALKSQDIA
jgi:ABC-type multidrug transport system ATPase subunit/pSer/pThr/pTyr-binding forkhead associated (FHA) protein